MKENNEKKMENCDEISKLIKAFPKDIAALDKRSVLMVFYCNRILSAFYNRFSSNSRVTPSIFQGYARIIEVLVFWRYNPIS